MTFRPTFNEVKRCHSQLAKIENYSIFVLFSYFYILVVKQLYQITFNKKIKDESYLEFTTKLKAEQQSKQAIKENQNKSKKKKKNNKSNKDSSTSDKISKPNEEQRQIEKNDTPSENESDEKEIEDKQQQISGQAPITSYNDFIQSLHGDKLKFFNEIYTACFTNNVTKLSQTLSNYINSDEDSIEKENRARLIENLLNKRLNRDTGFTLLHLVSQMGHYDCIWYLLSHGANPATPDLTKKHRVPYYLSLNKQTRDLYRRFMNDFPNKYDYKMSGVPEPLTEEQLNARQEKEKDKKRKKNKLKKQKEAQQKQKQKEIETELEERKKFLELTDQEKKKLILDRNFLNILPNQAEPISPKYSANDFKVISRCWYCGVDNSSNVPFEYFDYKFCSTKCLKAHKTQQTTTSNKTTK
jgi:hypothetical protein